MGEYKVMGLALLGNRRKYYNDVMSMIKLKSDGTWPPPHRQRFNRHSLTI